LSSAFELHYTPTESANLFTFVRHPMFRRVYCEGPPLHTLTRATPYIYLTTNKIHYLTNLACQHRRAGVKGFNAPPAMWYPDAICPRMRFKARLIPLQRDISSA